MDEKKIFQEQEFQELYRKRRLVSFVLTFLTMGIYIFFILLDAFDREIMAYKVFGGVTLGISMGIGVIIFSWILTGIYVVWANQKYDRQIESFRRKVGNIQ
ncbi:MAG: DUF485 domain-containing protein [Candidatus Atribacteria bacterium]|nr:DUF485 domain-containing protein [Candidatus Atribacteria bacterium]